MTNQELSTTGNLIMLSAGKEDRGAKATLAFAYATVALSMGIETKMFLTMDGGLAP